MRHHRIPALALGLLAAAAAIPTSAFEMDPRTGEIVVTSLTGFDRCVLDLSETPACLDALRRFANKRPNDSFQAGKRARLHYQHWRALSFFELAFRKKASDAQCADEDVLLAVISGLSRPPREQTTIALAQDLAANKCWSEIAEGLTQAVGDEGSYFKTNGCAVLASKGVENALCQQQRAAPAIAGDVARLADIRWRSLQLNGQSALALRGTQGERVFMVRSQGAQPVYLVKFTGIRGAANDQVFVTRERERANGREFLALIDGTETVLMATHSGWKPGIYEAYLPDYAEGLQVALQTLPPTEVAQVVAQFK